MVHRCRGRGREWTRLVALLRMTPGRGGTGPACSNSMGVIGSELGSLVGGALSPKSPISSGTAVACSPGSGVGVRDGMATCQSEGSGMLRPLITESTRSAKSIRPLISSGSGGGGGGGGEGGGTLGSASG